MQTLVDVLKEISESQFMTYIYILWKPNGTPFYVGKGVGNRVSRHEYEARSGKSSNPHKTNTINKIWREGEIVSYSIDSWHNTLESVNNREMELIGEYGRQAKNTGPLTNITGGGDGMLDMPDELKEQISQKLKKYFADDPSIVMKLQNDKNEWIENFPEEYQIARETLANVIRRPEVRKAISDTLKEYCKNPEVSRRLSEQAIKQFENEAARDRAREKAIENNSISNCQDWFKNATEEEKQVMKDKRYKSRAETYSTPEGKEILAKASEKRKKKVQTEEHRKHMSEKTSNYYKNNPEAWEESRTKAATTMRNKFAPLQKAYSDLEDKLLAEKKIFQRYTKFNSDVIKRLIGRGVLPKNFALKLDDGTEISYEGRA